MPCSIPNNKLYSNQDQIPAAVTEWQVKPAEVDDVPIVLEPDAGLVQ